MQKNRIPPFYHQRDDFHFGMTLIFVALCSYVIWNLTVGLLVGLLFLQYYLNVRKWTISFEEEQVVVTAKRRVLKDKSYTIPFTAITDVRFARYFNTYTSWRVLIKISFKEGKKERSRKFFSNKPHCDAVIDLLKEKNIPYEFSSRGLQIEIEHSDSKFES